jgi:hypothetical protein
MRARSSADRSGRPLAGVRARIEPFRLIPSRGDVQPVLTLNPAERER